MILCSFKIKKPWGKNNRLLSGFEGTYPLNKLFPNINHNVNNFAKFKILMTEILIRQDIGLKNFLTRKRQQFKKIPSYKELSWLHKNFKKNFTLKKYTIMGYSVEESQDIINKLKNNLRLTDEILIEKYGKFEGGKRVQKRKEYSKHNLETFIKKYGKEEGQRRYEIYRKTKNTSSLESYILRYGEKEGLKKHAEYCANVSYKNSLNYYIEKFGKEEGLEKYNELNFKKTKKFKLEGWIEEFGIEEGTKRWLNFNKTKVINFPKYLEKYGEPNFDKLFDKNFIKLKYTKDVLLKYLEVDQVAEILEELKTEKKLNRGHSSQTAREFLKPIVEYLKSKNLKNIHYGWDNKKEKIFKFGQNKNFVRFDLFCEELKLLIEFDGSYFHNTEKTKRNDKFKDNIAIKEGLTLFRFKEKEDNILEFYENIKKWIDERMDHEN